MTSTPMLAAAASSKKPQPLGCWERFSAIVVFLAGLVLVGGVIYWFGSSTENFRLVSKVTHGSGETARTTNYSDGIVIFSIATGAGLMLAGAFYARLREIRLGPVAVGVGPDLPEEQKTTVETKVKQRLRNKVSDSDRREKLLPAATALALQEARIKYLAATPNVTDDELSDVANVSVERLVAAVE
jgi:hypothetical protein